jgi:hypothetical protein
VADSQVEADGMRADDVHRIERLVQQGEAHLLEARTALRNFLFSQTGEDGEDEEEGSIGDERTPWNE